MLPNLRELSYEESLKILKLSTLKFRRIRGDMIETYKIVTGKYDTRGTKGLFTCNISSTTRGNSLKLVKHRSRLDLRKYYSTNRVMELWNSLPHNVVTAPNVKTFERRLDKHWREHPMIYDFTTDYNYTRSSKSNYDK